MFLAERNLLREHGHEVVEFTRHSDEIRKLGKRGSVIGSLSTPWNPFSSARMRRLLEKEKPDVVHVHNTFPLLSPSVFRAAAGIGTATVLTLHNYRTFCAAGIPMRGSEPCVECLELHSVLPALRYQCYRNSLPATLPVALMISLHRRIETWTRYVDAFIALTEFQKKELARGGLPIDRMHVKPHFYPNAPEPVIPGRREVKVVYIGRLGREKGIHVLLEAWNRWGKEAPRLELIGDGPERQSLVEMAERSAASDQIKFTGQLPFDEAQKHLARSTLLMLPSLCYEGFPMVIREAFALGVPVVASRLGSMPYIINDESDGRLFEPGNSEDLLRTVRGLWTDRERLAAMARNARRTFEEKYTADANYTLLMKIYDRAIEQRKRKMRAGR